LELFNQEYAKYELTQRISDSMRPFKAYGVLSLIGGYAAYPVNYKHLDSLMDADNSVKIDFTTYPEYLERAADTLTAPTAAHPVAYDRSGTGLFFAGTAADANVLIAYIKKPDDPYFDYYIDVTYEIKYLTEGQAAYTLQSGEAYRTGIGSGAVTSISKELDWDDTDKIKVANIILGYLGVQLEDQASYQHSSIKEQKDAALL
jgi:hypothetical protein